MFLKKAIASDKSQEQMLLDCLREELPLGKRGWAFHIGVSRLNNDTHKDNLKFSVDSFCSLVTRFQGRVFNLRNGDLVCVVKGGRISEVKLGVRRIQMLLHDDPLFHLVEDDRAPFLGTYDLDRKTNSLVRLVEAIAEGRTDVQAEPEAVVGIGDVRADKDTIGGTTGRAGLNGHAVADPAASQAKPGGHVLAGGATPAPPMAGQDAGATGTEQRWTNPEVLILERFGAALRALTAIEPTQLIRRQPV